MNQSTLFSYCIPIDDGAAPNPFWGICTLNICKPVIRRVANIGDWVVGTGSTKFNFSNHVVYAMKVTEKMPMEEYDTWAMNNCPNKIPDWTSKDHKRRLGDSIYVFKNGIPTQRPSVHQTGNIKTDLGGKYTLLSGHFYYFGNKPILLPPELRLIIKSGQGHRSKSNAAYVNNFIEWIEALGKKANELHGDPQIDLFQSAVSCNEFAQKRASCSEEDELQYRLDE